MGCTPSKEPVCRNCHAQCSPVRRSYSSAGDNGHVVALTSTTFGYLQLDSSKPIGQVHHEPGRKKVPEKNSNDFAVGVIEAKTWSKMIDEKMTKIAPKTPIRTPPGEPETINAWELMEDLDDTSPLRPPSAVADNIRCLSFNADSNSTDKSIASDFDLNVITTFRKSLELLPPTNPFHVKPSIDDDSKKPFGKTEIKSAGNKEKLILYFTSLRGVRKTYEDCCEVRVILKSSGARVDERDVSLHSGFKEELRKLLGDRYENGGLPKVFVGKKYIGGADEFRRLHDEFQLDKVLEGCEMADHGDGCKACGDIRFLPCDMCSGSCKIYYDVNSDEDENEAEKEENDYGFQRCPDCNENGLVRCPICCD